MKKLSYLFIVCLMIAVPSFASVLVVDQINGPYYAIYQAMQVATDGDTILLREGTYREYVYLTYGVSLIGDPVAAGKPVITTPSMYYANGQPLIEGEGNHTIENLELITNYDETLIMNEYGFLKVRNCVMFSAGKGIYAGGPGVDVIVEKCRIISYRYGIYLFPGGTGRVYDNIITTAMSGVILGIEYDEQNLAGGVSYVINNTIHSCDAGISSLGAGVLHAINNIISYSFTGINNEYAATITDNYNCFFSNDMDRNGPVTTGANDIYSDPLYVDVANNNLDISPSSPCVGAGDPNYQYTSASGLTVRLIGAGFHLSDATLRGAGGGPVVPAVTPAVAETLTEEVTTAYSGLPPFSKWTLAIGGERLDKAADDLSAGLISTADYLRRVETILKWYENLLDRLERDQAKRRPTIPAAIAGPMIDAARDVIAILEDFLDTYGG